VFRVSIAVGLWDLNSTCVPKRIFHERGLVFAPFWPLDAPRCVVISLVSSPATRSVLEEVSIGHPEALELLPAQSMPPQLFFRVSTIDARANPGWGLTTERLDFDTLRARVPKFSSLYLLQAPPGLESPLVNGSVFRACWPTVRITSAKKSPREDVWPAGAECSSVEAATRISHAKPL